MFKGSRRTFALMRLSWRVLMMDRELLLFPVLSIVTSIAVLGGTGLLLYLGFNVALALGEGPGRLLVYLFPVAVFGGVFTVWIVVTLFTAALTAAAQERLAGGNPNVRSGLLAARRTMYPLIKWGALRGAVAILTRRRRRRSRPPTLFGALPALGAFSWGVASYFVTPIILTQRVGPIEALKQSVQLLNDTWGEQLTAMFGFSALRSLPNTLAPVGPIFFWDSVGIGDIPLEVIWGAALTALVVWNIFMHTLESVFRAALYDHARGLTPHGFSADVLEHAYEPK